MASAVLLTLISGSIFATTGTFEGKIIETQYGLINFSQETTILKNSLDDNSESKNRQAEDFNTNALQIYDSEMIFSGLESELLNQKQINSQTLFSVLQKVDYNNQIDLEKIQLKLQILNTEQSINTEILVERLNQLIYNEQMFDGSDIDLNAIAYELLDEYDSEDIIIDLENLVTF